MLKSKRIWCFLAFVLFMVGVRWCIVSAFVEPLTGFYSPGLLPKIFDAIILLIGITGILFVFFSPEKTQRFTFELSSRAKLVMAADAIALGLFLIYDCLKNSRVSIQFLPDGIVNEQTMLIGSRNLLLQLFSVLAALLRFASGPVFLLQGAVLLLDKKAIFDSIGFKFAQIIPVFWTVINVMKIVTSYSTVCYISEHVVEVLALLFVMRVLYAQMELFVKKEHSKSFVRTYFVSSALAVLFCALATIPFYLNPVLQIMHDRTFYYYVMNFFLFLMGSYILTFLFGVSFTACAQSNSSPTVPISPDIDREKPDQAEEKVTTAEQAEERTKE